MTRWTLAAILFVGCAACSGMDGGDERIPPNDPAAANPGNSPLIIDCWNPDRWRREKSFLLRDLLSSVERETADCSALSAKPLDDWLARWGDRLYRVERLNSACGGFSAGEELGELSRGMLDLDAMRCPEDTPYGRAYKQLLFAAGYKTIRPK